MVGLSSASGGITFDEFHHPVGVGARGGYLQLGHDLAHQRDIFFQCWRHEGEHIGAVGGEALVVGHKLAGRKRHFHVFGEGHRVSRIAHVLEGEAVVGFFVDKQHVGLQRFAGAKRKGVARRINRRPGVRTSSTL